MTLSDVPLWPLFALAFLLLLPLLHPQSSLRTRLRTRRLIRQTVRVAGEVGVHITDLLGCGKQSEAYVLILRAIADECHLLNWRLLRSATQAAKLDAPGVDLIAAQLREFIEEHRQCDPEIFHGFPVPTGSPLAIACPVEVAEHAAHVERLRRHWRWTVDWLHYYRRAAA